METILVALAVIVVAALLARTAVRVRRVQYVRASAADRRRRIEHEQRLSELRMQRALQDTVQAMFEATRDCR